MKIQTEGIILRYLRYGDEGMIAHIYTKEYGRQAFIFKGIKSRKGKKKLHFLQPLSVVELSIDYKPHKELYPGNGAYAIATFQSIPFQQIKSGIAFFLAEFLGRVLQAHEGDELLFAFLKKSIFFLDEESTKAANFHLCFLVKLAEFLGIQPEAGRSSFSYLSISQGAFSETAEKDSLSLEQSRLWETIREESWEYCDKLPLSRESRHVFLQSIVAYYTYHLDDLGKLKSLSVLQEVFA